MCTPIKRIDGAVALQFFSRLVAWLLVGLLVGCHPYEFDQYCYRWRYEEARSCRPGVDSARVYLKPEHPCGTLFLDIIKDPCGCRMYVSTLCHVFGDVACSRNEVAVEIEIGGDSRLYTAYLFQGGQRLLLGDEAQEAIITALWEGNCVAIRMGIHKAVLTSVCFREAYDRLVKA